MELKTKCYYCKGKLFAGKFWIFGNDHKKWCSKEHMIKSRLEYLRKELRAERISYGEIAELQSYKQYIESGDVELLEAAGVPEFPQDTIEISWHIDDVKGMDGYEDMTDAECREVLQLAKDNHDATIGINWDVLQVWADEVKSRRTMAATA